MPSFTFNRTIRLTVDDDVAAAHPRAARETERDGQVSIVTAVELLEMQWRKRQPGAATPDAELITSNA